MPGPEWEYNILQMQQGRATHMADRLNQLADEGYEPFMVTGDETVTILLRRPKSAAPAAAPAE